MNRRQFLVTTGMVGIAGLAGCSGSRNGEPSAESTPSATASASATATPEGPRVAGEPLPLDDSDLSRGAPKDAIPAITEPAFADDWEGLTIEVTSRITGDVNEKEPRLRPDDMVVGLEREGEARAYPLRILNYHEVVNDEFAGPTLVTFCPLCGSGVTAERRVRGEETTFGVSGLLWMSDLVMYDELTGSLWSQIAGRSVRGPETGTGLTFVPSQLTTLQTWRESHPDTEVLLPPPESNTVRGREAVRDYTQNPYAGYEDSGQVGIGANADVDDRLNPKTQVLGITDDGAATAYPLETVIDRGGVVNDAVGDLPVVVTVGPDETSLFGFVRRVDGETITFEPENPRRMAGGGSLWSVSEGRAVEGPMEGTTLDPATEKGQLFWFAWADFNPDTAIFGRDE